MAPNSLTTRMTGAALLRTATFEEVEHDRDANGQAVAVVVIVALAQAIGTFQIGAFSMLYAAASSVVGVAVFAGLTYVVGRVLFEGVADWGEVFRSLAFAQSPGVLAVLGLLPFVGWLAEALVAFWVLWASIIAIRQSLDVGTLQAIATGVVAGLLWVVLAIVF